MEKLLLHELVRWDEHNEYEGHCLASWHGRQACFYLHLEPDEWARLELGMNWGAMVQLQRFTEVRLNVAETPVFEQIQGVNYRVQGLVQFQEGENLILAMPWGDLHVDLDQPQPVSLCGLWVHLQGVLKAKPLEGNVRAIEG